MNMSNAYMTRLKPGVDDELIRFLEPYLRARRVSEVIRAALAAYARQGMPPMPAPAAPVLVPVNNVVMPASAPAPVGDVVNKARSAFFK